MRRATAFLIGLLATSLFASSRVDAAQRVKVGAACSRAQLGDWWPAQGGSVVQCVGISTTRFMWATVHPRFAAYIPEERRLAGLGEAPPTTVSSSPAPTFGPDAISGTGRRIIDVPGGVSTQARLLAVEMQCVDACVLESYEKDGRASRMLDPARGTVRELPLLAGRYDRIAVEASRWTVEFRPLSTVRTITPGTTLTGRGLGYLLLEGDYKQAAIKMPASKPGCTGAEYNIVNLLGEEGGFQGAPVGATCAAVDGPYILARRGRQIIQVASAGEWSIMIS